MHLTPREFWTAFHGMVLGAAYLLAFTGGFAAIWSYRSEWLTEQGRAKVYRRMVAAVWIMTLFAWSTTLLGTYVVYPWYRAKALPGISASQLGDYPKYLLLSNPRTADWHEFGMEWKEHIAWFAPILATAVAFVATRYRRLAEDTAIRRVLLTVYSISFFCAAVAGLLGALINKAAPTR